MIKLKQIKLSNFLSHSVTKIEFGEDQKVLLSGKSGAGKSSVIEALVWGLYEKGRSDNRSMVRHGEKKMEIIVDLYDNETKYKIIRSVTDKGKHNLEVFSAVGDEKFVPVEALGIKGAQEFIEKNILKASYLLFVNSIAYLQDGTESFVKQTALKRKDILLEIANASAYDELYKKTKEAAQIREGKIGVSESTIFYLREDIKRYNESLKEKGPALIKKDEHEKKLSESKDKLKAIRAEKETNSKAIVEMDTAFTAMNVIDEKGKTLNEAYVEVAKKIAYLDNADIPALKKELEAKPALDKEREDQEEKYKVSAEWNVNMMELVKQRPVDIMYDKKIAEINAKIISIMGEKIDICPEIDKPCPIIEKKQQGEISYWNELLDDATRDKKDYERAVAKNQDDMKMLGEEPVVDHIRLREVVETIKALEDVEAALTNAEFNKKRTDELTIETVSLSQKIAESSNEFIIAQEKFLKLKAGVTSGAEYDSKIDEYELVIAVEGRNLTEIDAKLMLLDNFEDKIDEINKEIAMKMSETSKIKEEIDNLMLLKEAFGANGVKSIMIDFIIPRLEDSINRILHQLSDFTVRLDTQKQGVGASTVLEGLFITIFNEKGEEHGYEAFSGGEKVKVSFAINEALAEISKIDFRIMDEAVVALDAESVEQFLEALSSIQSKVSQILCISHIQEIKDVFPETITISKKDGISIIN